MSKIYIGINPKPKLGDLTIDLDLSIKKYGLQEVRDTFNEYYINSAHGRCKILLGPLNLYSEQIQNYLLKVTEEDGGNIDYWAFSCDGIIPTLLSRCFINWVPDNGEPLDVSGNVSDIFYSFLYNDFVCSFSHIKTVNKWDRTHLISLSDVIFENACGVDSHRVIAFWFKIRDILKDEYVCNSKITVALIELGNLQ